MPNDTLYPPTHPGVLDSLLEHIAVLDPEGSIVAVNRAWRQFGLDNGAPVSDGYQGRNYLDVCRAAVRSGDEGAAFALRGIREVLDGSRLRFIHEYPCHAPDRPRWFLMSVTPLHRGGGAVASHLDVTQRKRTEQELTNYRRGLENLVAVRTAELTETNRRLRREIDERKLLEAELQHQLHHDALTGLPNRLLLEQRFGTLVERNTEGVALVYLDLDRFKYVNDALGHPAGDELLIQFTERLRSAGSSAVMLARLGGDEFAMLLGNVDRPSAERTVERLRASLEEPFDLRGHRFALQASIGVAFGGGEVKEFSELLRRADLAMYRAKAQGNRVSLYDAEVDRRVQEWSWVEHGLRHAYQQGALDLYFQPVLELSSRRSSLAEALLRWVHPERGLVPPSVFVPVAEETGFITDLDRWVVDESLRHAEAGDFAVAVNLTPRTLQDKGFLAHLHARLAHYGLGPERLFVEVTERVLAQLDVTLPILNDLNDLGVRVVVDDFGTGYSSLAYLQHYPLHTLKLDQSFVRLLGEDATDEAIATSVIQLAHSLGLQVIAEGVETAAQLAWLEAAGCDQVQGYAIGAPMALGDLIAWRTGRSTGRADPR